VGRRATAAAAVAVAALLPAPALGSTRDAGGSSIASAVALPLTAIVDAATAPRAGVQYWKVDLGVGDLLVVVFASASGPANTAGICILPPTATDATVAQTHCLATVPDIHWTTGRVQVVHVAESAGTYYVAAGRADRLRAVAPDAVKQCAEPAPLAYQIGGQVLKPTSLSVHGPHHTAAHTRLHIAGTVGGAAGGTVEVALFGPAGFHPIDRETPLTASGAFALDTRPLPRGHYRLTISYAGDVGHRPSRRTIAITVG
jgi:hypothetical protein